MNKTTVLDIHFEYEGIEASLHPVLLSDKKDLVLVDTAYAGFLPLLEEAIADAGEDISRLSTVILTSAELDHVGAIPELLEKYPNIKIMASEQDRRYLEKEKHPKTAAAIMEETGKSIDQVDQLEEPFASLVKMLMDQPAIHVDEIIKSRDFKHCGGGVEFVCESFQTMLYGDEDQLLIAGDVFQIAEDGTLEINQTLYGTSARDLLELMNYLTIFQIDAITCFHGGLYTEDVKTAFEKIYNQLSEKFVSTVIPRIELESGEVFLDQTILNVLSPDEIENIKEIVEADPENIE